MEILNDLQVMQPEITLTAGIIVMLLADLILSRPNHTALHRLACVLTAVMLVLNLMPHAGQAFGGMYSSTPLGSALNTILTAGTFIVFLQSDRWLSQSDTQHKSGEFYVLTLSTLLGMYFMVSAGHFLLFYIGLELASIPMACLVAFDKYRHHSAEAGAKFALSAMFSSALMLYGLSLLYGGTGTLYFDEMPALLSGTTVQTVAMVFFFSGLGFKLSLVPFHMWTPDTYQGAPTSVTGYLSVISKGAAAFALIIILTRVFGPMTAKWSVMLETIIVLTITVANIFAILQKDLKRFMAYSSVSQAGYILLAVLGDQVQGPAALVYYLVVYVAANLAVFGVINTIENHCNGTVDRDSYRGLYTTNPRLTLVMTLALFSLAGIPPFAGFFSKFFVFAAAFHTGHWLTVFLALVNTIISLYYYLLVVKAMYIEPSQSPLPRFHSSASMRLALLVCVAGIILLGLCSPVYDTLTRLAGL